MTRCTAPDCANATKAYRWCVRMGRKYGLLLGADTDNHAMIATPHAQRRASIRRAVLDCCGLARFEAPSDEAADKASTKIADQARRNALITSAYAGNVSIATPATQRRDGSRGRVLAMHRMTE
ncbi:MAG: hypothetical protein OXK74_02210 [Gemmatimonadota bacterium]|nr:hypothetical protein [Gemmatimonadota bacterium]